MKPKNNKEVIRSYWHFSGYLASCILLGILVFFFYLKTSSVELNRIVDKTSQYDNIYFQQIEIASRIDSLYRYTTMFNLDMNDIYIQNAVSKRRQNTTNYMEKMNPKDVQLFRKLMTQMNTFLSMKDSIRLLRIEEDNVRSDLLKCMEDNRAVTRRIHQGNMSSRR